MDLQDLQRYARAAREISVTVGPADAPRHITLRAPTQHEITVAARRSGMGDQADDKAAMVILQRSLLLLAVVAWSGVLVGDVLPDSGQAADVLPYEAGAVELLLDAKPEWAKALSDALMERMAQRSEAKDTAVKN